MIDVRIFLWERVVFVVDVNVIYKINMFFEMCINYMIYIIFDVMLI